MPSVHRQENNIVHAIRGCAKSTAPDVLYVARIDVYRIDVYSFLAKKYLGHIWVSRLPPPQPGW